MDWNIGSGRIVDPGDADASAGSVRWRAGKSLWMGGMTLVALTLGPLTFTPGAFVLFLVTTAITLCAGHSVGMHRRLIHNSFDCPKWLEYVCVYLGVLVGMAGPIGMIRQHDLRDWAQRRTHCHDYLRHGRGFWTDAWWQLHCDLQLTRGPMFQLEPALANDRCYYWMERTWMWQQLPWALLFYAIGGWSWVIWGICVRVSVSVTGHWLIGHFAHRQGPMTWEVRGAGVQGRNVPIAALFSMGESWHNNHHAFPGSARLGLLRGEADPGWWLIQRLKCCGLVWSINTPETLPPRAALHRVDRSHRSTASMHRYGDQQQGHRQQPAEGPAKVAAH
ncbi:acyl-CoA desaturase [Steroidobacter flavus]|uniref:Acyl-CoA desaturase n=1 Tax=Steroidobacter flavus TaxID=1842136 RepID=A0ABV8SUX1_9GAMM